MSSKSHLDVSWGKRSTTLTFIVCAHDSRAAGVVCCTPCGGSISTRIYHLPAGDWWALHCDHGQFRWNELLVAVLSRRGMEDAYVQLATGLGDALVLTNTGLVLRRRLGTLSP